METSHNLEIYIKQNWQWWWLMMPMRRIYHEYLPLKINTLLNGKLMDWKNHFLKELMKNHHMLSIIWYGGESAEQDIIGWSLSISDKDIHFGLQYIIAGHHPTRRMRSSLTKNFTAHFEGFSKHSSSDRPVEIALCINPWGCLSDFLQRLSPWLGKF